MPLFTCIQCGAQFPESEQPPRSCPICEDERQFVNWNGQAWLAREELAKTHKLVWRDDLGVPGIGMEPSFAIGQRALLLCEADGCVMWDCVPLATSEAVRYVRSLGGLKAIAVSHPHFYGAVADWSEAFGGVPVYLHDWYGQGRHAMVVSMRSPEFKIMPELFHTDVPLTGDESRVAEVKDIAFPKLLDPVDDLPPTTVITHVSRSTPGKLVVRGTTADNGVVKRVVVNGKEARALTANFAEWEATLDAPTGGRIQAHAEDAAGNIEPRPHGVALK